MYPKPGGQVATLTAQMSSRGFWGLQNLSSSYAQVNNVKYYELQFNKASDRVGYQRWASLVGPTEGAGIWTKLVVRDPRKELLSSLSIFAGLLSLSNACVGGGTGSYRSHIWGTPRLGFPSSLCLALDPFSGKAPGILCPS